MTNPFADDNAPLRGRVPTGNAEPPKGTLPVSESPFLAPDGNPQAPSVEATNLVEAGAAPYQPDVAAMLAQMKALQERVDSLQADRGIPSDPVEAAVKNLLAHVRARKAANPSFDFAELIEQLQYLEEHPDFKPDDSAAQLTALAVEDAVERGGRDFVYLRELARDFRKAVLKAAGATEKQADRVAREWRYVTS